MNSHRTIVDLATVAVVLSANTHGLPTAFGRAGLVHAADRFGMGMVLRDDLLAAVSELLFIPLDQFEKTWQRPRCDFELQGNAFGRFAVQIRQLTFDINPQQIPRLASPKAIGEQREKQRQLPSQRGNLL
jgi:hypothetical protein